jgi:hypothetical protein
LYLNSVTIQLHCGKKPPNCFQQIFWKIKKDTALCFFASGCIYDQIQEFWYICVVSVFWFKSQYKYNVFGGKPIQIHALYWFHCWWNSMVWSVVNLLPLHCQHN